MAVTYTPREIGHMQALADKQGITLEEIKKKRALDEEYSTYVDPKLEASRKERLGLTAATKADIFASLRPKNEWDICAGNCIINEAGGKLIDLNGKRVIFNRETTRIQPGLIAGEKSAVDKTLTILT